MGSSYRSHRREDCIRKANRASQLNNADSARTRERDGEIARQETGTSGLKHIWGSQLKSAPLRERRGSLDREEGQSVT